jgi:hypothetical protein
MPKFDKKTRDKIIKRLRNASLSIESELIEQCWKAALAGNKKPSIKISSAARKKYRDELIQMQLFFFRQAYKGAKVKVKETVENIDIFMQGAYVEKAKQYQKWFTDVATKLENKRYKDTVTRANKIVQTSIEQGLTRPQMRELMQEKFESYSESELDRVITTEGTRSMNLGTVSSGADDDEIVGYRVAVNYTGCEICDAKMAETAGDYIPKEDLTEEDTPPFHPNCNCSLEPVFRYEVEE